MCIRDSRSAAGGACTTGGAFRGTFRDVDSRGSPDPVADLHGQQVPEAGGGASAGGGGGGHGGRGAR
eukprot:4013316-Pyramimonas_sp.AAC.1